VAWRGVAWRGVAWRGVVWRAFSGTSKMKMRLDPRKREVVKELLMVAKRQ
jgi:hypothetical protein